MEQQKLSKIQGFKILVKGEIIIGTLLGDAHLRANQQKTKYQLIILQLDQHKEYVFHL